MKSMDSSRRNKRGVSPLIATILLIAFAVALGAVVMNWGRNIDITEEQDLCSTTSLKVDEINGIPQIFYGGEETNGFVEFTIENDGSQDISGLIVWVVGETDTMISNLGNVEIKVGYPLTKKLSYNLDKYGEIKKVKFIPQITIDEGMLPCPKNGVEEEKISRL